MIENNNIQIAKFKLCLKLSFGFYDFTIICYSRADGNLEIPNQVGDDKRRLGHVITHFVREKGSALEVESQKRCVIPGADPESLLSTIKKYSQ